MVADTSNELEGFAAKLGLSQTWCQNSGTWDEHYDLTKTKRALAVKLGAVEVDRRTLARIRTEKRHKHEQEVSTSVRDYMRRMNGLPPLTEPVPLIRSSW